MRRQRVRQTLRDLHHIRLIPLKTVACTALPDKTSATAPRLNSSLIIRPIRPINPSIAIVKRGCLCIPLRKIIAVIAAPSME